MLSAYLNQTAELQRVAHKADGSTKMDNRGQIQYESVRTVKCRKRLKMQEVLTPDSQVIKANWTYHLMDEVRADDLLDGKRVQLVFDQVMLGGNTVGHRAVV